MGKARGAGVQKGVRLTQWVRKVVRRVSGGRCRGEDGQMGAHSQKMVSEGSRWS